MAKLLSKSDILKADDLKTETVPVPEWGGDVRIRTLTAAQKDDFEAASLQEGKKGQRKANLNNFRAKFCALVMVDDKGERLFGDAEVTKLGMKSCAAMDRVYDVAGKLNAMGQRDLEELAKNSEKIQDDSSASV